MIGSVSASERDFLITSGHEFSKLGSSMYNNFGIIRFIFWSLKNHSFLTNLSSFESNAEHLLKSYKKRYPNILMYAAFIFDVNFEKTLPAV